MWAWWNKSIFWPPLATTWTNVIWTILLKPIAPRHCRFVLAKVIIELIPLCYWKCRRLGIDMARTATGENKSRLPLCFNSLWSQFFLPLLNHWALPGMLNMIKETNNMCHLSAQSFYEIGTWPNGHYWTKDSFHSKLPLLQNCLGSF